VKWAGAPTRRQMHQVGSGTPRRGLCEVVTGCSAACRPVRPRCSPISLAFSRHEHIGRSFRWSWQPQNSTSRNMRNTETLTWGLLKVTTGRVCVSLARCAAASLGAAPIPPSPLKYRLSINFFFFDSRVLNSPNVIFTTNSQMCSCKLDIVLKNSIVCGVESNGVVKFSSLPHVNLLSRRFHKSAVVNLTSF